MNCISNSKESHTLDMQIIAKAHQHKEECFLTNILARIQTNNMLCTPKFLKNYPKYPLNHTSWCQDEEIYEIIGDIYQNNCSTPCSSIEYQNSMEPYHGVEAINSEYCGEPSIILNFQMIQKVILIKVREEEIFMNISRYDLFAGRIGYGLG
jgi:hypothetical protein